MSYENFLSDFDAIYADHQTAVARDLKINFKRIFEDSSLSKEEATMAALAVSKSLSFEPLEKLSRKALRDALFDSGIIREVEESAAIMGMLNTYYRFRHFVDKHQEGEGYGAARLRMQSLGNPAVGKERFEMLAFAVSIINGCEMCVTSHEKALKNLGVEVEKLHDLARLAASVKGLSSLSN